jgi:hypothetical protein
MEPRYQRYPPEVWVCSGAHEPIPSCRLQGVWAEVKVGGEHLRLFSEHNALGVQASVYNVNAKNWIAPSEPETLTLPSTIWPTQLHLNLVDAYWEG